MQPVVGGDASKLALVSEQSDLLDMITLRFSEASSYAIGDYVLYFNNVFDGLYRFKEAKTPGVWDGTKVEQVSLTSILKKHESDISSLNADKLVVHTIFGQKIGYSSKTTIDYTGLYVDLPANAYVSVTGRLVYNNSRPLYAIINSSPNTLVNSIIIADSSVGMNHVAVSASFSTTEPMTIYLWAQYSNEAINNVLIDGFYIT